MCSIRNHNMNQRNLGLSPDYIQIVSASCLWVNPLSILLFLRQTEYRVLMVQGIKGIVALNSCVVQGLAMCSNYFNYVFLASCRRKANRVPWADCHLTQKE